VLGGIYAGYNFQIQKWLLGIEADVQGLDRNRADAETVVGSFTGQPANFPPLGTTMTLSARNNWLASVRGRAGFIFGASDELLVYGTGGAAFTNTRYAATFTPSTNPASLFGFGFPSPAAAFGVSSTSFSQDKVGWVAGGGLEWRFAPNWFVRGEYLHYQFAGTSGVVPAVLLNGTAACAGCRWTASWSSLSFDTGRIGIAYKF
jgi:outer membrane immunogenic protein